MAPSNNAFLKVSFRVSPQRARITAIAVLLVISATHFQSTYIINQ